jgi:hypothetical protein
MASCEMSPVPQPVCEWTYDSRKFTIHFAPDVMERLGSESWMAFKRVPHRGLEIGGILLGRKVCEGDSTTFWIDGFEIVESEHKSGPSYVLSESDWTALQAAMIKNGEASIGVFRSNTRSERPALVEPDVQLFKRCFDSSEALFLMLAPLPKVVAIFTGADGNLTCIQELPLSSPIAPVMGTRPERPRGNAEPPLFQEAETRLPRLPRQLDLQDYIPHLPHPGLGRRRMRAIPIPAAEESLLPTKMQDWALIIATSATIFVLTVGAYLYLHRPPRVVAPAYEHFHLTVERAGTSLHLLWDRNNPSIRTATHAILHITDGGFSSDRNLSAAMLWAGSFTYEPKSAEETFQLDVYSDAPAGTGVIQVMNSLPQNPAPVVKPVTPASRVVPLQAAAPASRTLTKGNTVPPPVVLEKKDVLPAPKSENPKSENPKAVNKVEDPPIARSIPAATPEKWRQPTPFATNPSIALATPVSYPPAAPTVEMSAEPVEGSRVGRLVGKIPLVRRLKRPSRVASPVPVFQAKPKVQLAQEDRPSAPVAVNVKVRVAESGTVMQAEVQDYGDPPNWRLAAAALDAARRWTFEPARVEDTAIPSDVILHFRFTP